MCKQAMENDEELLETWLVQCLVALCQGGAEEAEGISQRFNISGDPMDTCSVEQQAYATNACYKELTENCEVTDGLLESCVKDVCAAFKAGEPDATGLTDGYCGFHEKLDKDDELLKELIGYTTTTTTTTTTTMVCGAGANVNDFSSKSSMEEAGWSFSVDNENASVSWKHKGYAGVDYTQNVPADCIWFHATKGNLEVQRTLVGDGTVTFVFGNQFERDTGIVKVFLNNVEKSSASAAQYSESVTFSFVDGDSLKLGEYGTAIIILCPVEFTCGQEATTTTTTTTTTTRDPALFECREHKNLTAPCAIPANQAMCKSYCEAQGDIARCRKEQACSWADHQKTFSRGYAGNVNTKFPDLASAKSKCTELGSATCKAVTCESGICTVRGSSTLETTTRDDFVTYVPTNDCYACFWVGHQRTFSRGYAGNVNTKFSSLASAKRKCTELGSATCKAVTCESGICTVRGSSTLETTTRDDFVTYVPTNPCYSGLPENDQMRERNRSDYPPGCFFYSGSGENWMGYNNFNHGDSEPTSFDPAVGNARLCCGSLALVKTTTTTTRLWQRVLPKEGDRPPLQPLPASGTPVTIDRPSNPQSGTCYMWGDPHFAKFDGSTGDHYGTGVYWIMKTDSVWIQGYYASGSMKGPGHTYCKKLAIGGPFLQGNTLMVETSKIWWNGDGEIMNMGSFGEQSWTGMNGKVKVAMRINRSVAMLGVAIIGDVYIYLPMDKILIKSRIHIKMIPTTLTPVFHRTSIETTQIVGQEGHCGNFDGSEPYTPRSTKYKVKKNERLIPYR